MDPHRLRIEMSGVEPPSSRKRGAGAEDALRSPYLSKRRDIHMWTCGASIAECVAGKTSASNE